MTLRNSDPKELINELVEQFTYYTLVQYLIKWPHPTRLSLIPRPNLSREEKGLVTIEQFLGGSESAAAVISNKP